MVYAKPWAQNARTMQNGNSDLFMAFIWRALPVEGANAAQTGILTIAVILSIGQKRFQHREMGDSESVRNRGSTIPRSICLTIALTWDNLDALVAFIT